MSSLDDLIGSSAPMAALRTQVQRLLTRPNQVGGRMPPLLILGETGTGKGLLVRIMHRASIRRDMPLVEVNCAAIPENLVEAELFGFERGAFTDARQAKPGLFQAAHRGVLFLDEVGSLPAAIQAKLLTALEQREVRRLGSTRSEPVDVWIFSATNEDLSANVARGAFRLDLYHRISTVKLQMPPLRERGRDVITLAGHFLKRAYADYALAPKRLTPAAQEALLAHPWAGNIRELANLMERVVLLTDSDEITAELLELPPPAGRTRATTGPTPGPSPEADPGALIRALEATQWNLSRAAAHLGIPRNTLRYRIERFGLKPGTAPAASQADGASSEPAPVVGAVAAQGLRWERRWITAVLARLDRPPSISEFRLTPLLANVIQKFESFGGRVEELHPLGFTALFGAEPMEDAPGRAALAAHAAQRLVEDAPSLDRGHVTLTVALHVAESLIARGGPVPGMDLEDRRQLGHALRALAEAAPPAVTAVSDAAARFLNRRFSFEPLVDPQLGFRLLGPARSDFEVAERGQSPLVGRDRELSQLDDLLAQAEAGRGQLVGLVGEPGVGKSRLLYEFRHSLGLDRIAYLEARCAGHGTRTPYLPLAALIRQAFGFSELDAPDAIGKHVREGAHALGLDPDAVAPFLFHLLGVSDDRPSGLGPLSPVAMRSRTMEVLREVVIATSQQRPMILAIEDLQWIDPTSEECLGVLADSAAACRILLLGTYRHGYRPPWLAKSYATQLVLRRLGPAESLSIVKSAAAAAPLSAEIANAIVARADGVPFFLEELARALSERTGTGAMTAIPETIQGVLAARLDQLPVDDKAVLQAAAVVGKDGPVALLQEIAGHPEAEFGRALARLAADEFLHETGVVPTRQYTFLHVLTQEVAYLSLLPDRRRELHAAAVRAIERLTPQLTERTPELLAHHSTEGGLTEQAISYWHRAGQLAAGRSAYIEAIAHLDKGLALLETLPDGPERVQKELMLRLALVGSLIATSGEASAGLDKTLARARELVSLLGDSPQLFPVRFGLWRLAMARADLGSAETGAAELLGIAGRAGDSGLSMAANVAAGATSFYCGQFERARAHFEAGLTFHNPELTAAQVLAYGQDLEAVSLGYLGWVEAIEGRLDRAVAYADRGLESARRAGHPFSVAFALMLCGMVWQLRREPAATARFGEELLALARSQGFVYFVAVGLGLSGLAAAASGDAGAGFARMREGAQLYQTLNHRLGLGYRTHLAEALALSGATAEAIDIIDHAIAEGRNGGDVSHIAELLRIRGEAHTLAGRPAEARADLLEAYATASRQGAHLFALRAAMALVSGSPPLDPAPAARARLAATYALFTEGHHLDDLVASRRLLDEVGRHAG